MLALAPECGCTLACSAPNSALARSTGEVLDLVDERVAAVVALARVALGVLVGEHRAGGREHRRRGEVLGRDQLQGRVLPLDLAVDEGEELVVAFRGPRHTASVPTRIVRPWLLIRAAPSSSASASTCIGPTASTTPSSPVDLMVEAVRAAAADAGAANVLSHAQSLRVVQLLSWRYRDPARARRRSARHPSGRDGVHDGGWQHAPVARQR